MVSYGPLISKKSKMWQWCSCPTNSLQPPYCNLMNMQGRIAVYQPIDINVHHIFTEYSCRCHTTIALPSWKLTICNKNCTPNAQTIKCKSNTRCVCKH